MRHPARQPFADAKKRQTGASSRSHFNPLQPRGGDGRWVPVGARIDSAAGLAGSNTIHHVTIGAVRKAGALSKLTGKDVRGFKHAVSNQSIAHATKNHRDLTPEDLRKIPDVVRLGEVDLAAPAKNGSPRLRYRATIDGVRYGYVAEVRRKQMRVDMVTFYRR